MKDINDLTHEIIGCAMKVHSELGSGFQEIIYQRALSIELNNASIGHEREKEIPIEYKGQIIGTRRVDFHVENRVMVEIKALETLLTVHKTQAINYLEAYKIADGILINFGSSKLEFNRVYNSKFKGNSSGF
jgi:GxxExxY protein